MSINANMKVAKMANNGGHGMRHQWRAKYLKIAKMKWHHKWRRGENGGNRRKMKRININKRDMAGEMAIKRRQ
jgi:hypothetical protein